MKVHNMESSKGNIIPNQFIIENNFEFIGEDNTKKNRN